MRRPRRRRTFWLVPLVLLAAGCSGKLAQLKAQAATDLHCPEQQVMHKAMQTYVEQVFACGRENVYLYDHTQEDWVSPLERATFDLGCPRERIAMKVLDNRSVGASGCGRQTVYVLTQTVEPTPFGPRLQNGWVANVLNGPANAAR
jgi:hypothetical protein